MKEVDISLANIHPAFQFCSIANVLYTIYRNCYFYKHTKTVNRNLNLVIITLSISSGFYLPLVISANCELTQILCNRILLNKYGVSLTKPCVQITQVKLINMSAMSGCDRQN